MKGLTISQEAQKPGVAAATAGGGGNNVKRAGHRSNVSGSTTSSQSSLSLPTDASGTASSSSSPSLPSSAFSSSAGSTDFKGSNQSYQSKLTEQLANLEIGVEFKLDLRSEDLEPVHELGHGNGGTVTLVRHIPTSAIMARKVRWRHSRCFYL